MDELLWYWDPTEERIYTDKQYEALTDGTIKKRLKSIPWKDWMALIENQEGGKHIGNNPDTNLPTFLEDTFTEEELLLREKAQLESYLQETNTEALLYVEKKLFSSVSLLSSEAESYESVRAGRLQAYERIKEIEALLSAE